MATTTKITCTYEIWSGYSGHQCGRPAKFTGVFGDPRCGLHNPNKARTKAQIQADEDHKRRASSYEADKLAHRIAIAVHRGEEVEQLVLDLYYGELLAAGRLPADEDDK